MEPTNKNTKIKCAILYVLYNPDLSLLVDSLTISRAQVERIYLIDNSDDSSTSINGIILDEKIKYTKFHENKGIAFALNYGCKEAIKENFDWLIAFDQDSIPPNNLVETYSSLLSKMDGSSNVGVLTLLINNKYKGFKMENSFTNVLSAITSGSCISLSAFSKIGGFKDELFIDCVDHEFSLNLRVNNYKILRLNNVALSHKFGDEDKVLTIFNRYICGTHKRSHLRYYYMVRNYSYVINKYSNFDTILCNNLRKELAKTLIKMLILEDNKFKKIQSSLRGYVDYKKNKYGKYRY